MREALFVFAFLGVAAGIIFDFITALEKALGVKWLAFIVDFLAAVLFCVVYGCVMIAYSNGRFKGLYFLCGFISFVIYLLTFHKILSPVFCAVFAPIRKILKKISKNLKKDEKILKKVLHLGK